MSNPRRSSRRSIDQPSTSSSNEDPELTRESVELCARLFARIRAIRDSRENSLLSKARESGHDEISARELVSSEMGPLNDHIQKLEMGTIGVLFENLIKDPTYSNKRFVEPIPSTSWKPSSPSKRSPEKPMSPIEVKVEEPGPSKSPSTTLSASESVVEKAAKQEAQVMARIAELRKAGLWTATRLPLCTEPARNKTHWDYLLDEVKWMAADFKHERTIKKNWSRKICASIVKIRKDREEDEERAEQKQIRETKRVCANIAKMVREFWQNVDKVVDFRAQEILESRKRKALDQHLSFIVSEADKLSSIMQEGLLTDKTSKSPSIASKEDGDDEDFCMKMDDDASDDESTIAKEEKISKEDSAKEVKALEQEADQDLDDMLASLPPGYLEAMGYGAGPSTSGSTSEPGESNENDEEKNNEEEVEDEQEEEMNETSEETEVKEDSDETIRKSSSPPLKRRKIEELEDVKEKEPENSTDSAESTIDRNQDVSDEGNGDGRGVLQHVDYNKLNSKNSDERQQELTNIAEEALKFQPKGYTLDTTQVKTEVPFLVRGSLREYQMVGLDWLVTLYESNLNGILADEMGLGKTIQTIALLAHLACAEAVWGPHLIIVPTSVILNWEMELKKWCPAFKILTYFGNLKDRQEKRKGWNKPNAFHVCITSYKTVTADIRAFKKKAWQYMILDEAQNIKNWKSQRWQALLNVRARRRLLLTGTPLQNSLMELWSLMHFLMPAIFASHDDFKDWFSNPLTGMMEGSVEYNAPLVQRLHKVLRPFILRRLKSEVEKQLPSKTEHVIKCHLSKRQRYLYDDFMSRRSTKDNLKSGNMLSVLNIVMQLRKCCNHPNLFEPRPVVSPFVILPMELTRPAQIFDICGEEVDPHELKSIPDCLDIRDRLYGYGVGMKNRRPLVEEIAHMPDPIEPPKVPGFKMALPALQREEPASAFVSPAVIDVSAAELRRAGFGQNEMFLVVGEGDDLDSVLNNGDGPLRVRVDCGRVVLDDGMSQQPADRARICQVVTVNGEKTLRDVGRNGEIARSAMCPTTEAATAEPSAAHLPSASAASSSAAAITPVAKPMLGAPKKNNVVPLLRTRTVTYPTNLRVNTEESSGFHNIMANGGARESIVNYNYQFSPPLKRKRVPSPPLIENDEYAEFVSEQQMDVIRSERNHKINKILDRFQTIHEPILSYELIGALRRDLKKKVICDDDECKMESSLLSEDGRILVTTVFDDYLAVLTGRFSMYVEPALCGPVNYKASSSGRSAYAKLMDEYRSEVARCFLENFHPNLQAQILSRQLQFPELRLIEYDCGKLQTLAPLLRELFLYNHRCLIFTQMSKMLDILQAFLSYHGYSYFRLDGTTGIEQRQAMMERFNADPKIFCFILSTRSGGVGVNLTGADTVIFYDSDWNPTMDAQAQDRCHRIGQTRNVTIYRLISDRTIEENILRKAMQKRRLGEMAIDEAGFTPDFFKQSDNLRDLFEGDAAADEIRAPIDAPKNQKDFEKAMASLEDEQDVAAAKLAQAEAKADRAEFDEATRIPTSHLGTAGDSSDDKYFELISQLQPIERYAVSFLETEYKPDFDEQIKEAEAAITQKKDDWVKAQEKALVEDVANDDDFYGCGSFLDEILADDSNFSEFTMPTWGPPTPPPDGDDDIYHDDCLDLLYDPDFMGESKLPPIIHELHRPLAKTSPRKESRRHNIQVVPHQPPPQAVEPNLLHLKTNHDMDMSSATPSPMPPYADECSMDYTDVRTETSSSSRKERRPREIRNRTEVPRAVTPPPPVREDKDYEGPEWTIMEDFALLQAIRSEDTMSHTIEKIRSALVYNWEYIAGFVNWFTRFYRSPRQCCIRYQRVVRPRELGQLVAQDPFTKKNCKVQLTQAEIQHLRKNRTTTNAQLMHDMGDLVSAQRIGRLNMFRELAAAPKILFRRRPDPFTFDPARVPQNHEAKLSELNIRPSSAILAEEILTTFAENTPVDQKKKQIELKRRDEEDRDSHQVRTPRVCIRPPAVQAGNGLVTTKSPYVVEIAPLQPLRPPPPPQQIIQSQTEHMISTSSSMSSSTQFMPRRTASVGGGMSHMVQSSAQHNYVVVSHEQPPLRVQTVQRPDGTPTQQMFRPLGPQAQRTPPHTPRTGPPHARTAVSYVTTGNMGSQQGGYITNQSGQAVYAQQGSGGQGALGGVQRQAPNRLLQRQGRVFVGPSGQIPERAYVMQQPVHRMMPAGSSSAGPNQRLAAPKRVGPPKAGQQVMSTTMVVPGPGGRPPQSQQLIRTVPRGSGNLPTATRVMLASGGQQIRTAGGQIIQNHPGQSVTRQLLATRTVGLPRTGSPQMTQVVIAPSTVSQVSQQQQQQQTVQMSAQSQHQVVSQAMTSSQPPQLQPMHVPSSEAASPAHAQSPPSQPASTAAPPTSTPNTPSS